MTVAQLTKILSSHHPEEHVNFLIIGDSNITTINKSFTPIYQCSNVTLAFKPNQEKK